MNRKISILVILLFVFSFSVVQAVGQRDSIEEDTPYSVDIDPEDAGYELNYGEAADVTLSCDSSAGDCSGINRHELYMCGKKLVFDLSGNEDTKRIAVGTGQKAGAEVPCSTEIRMELWQGYRDSGGSFIGTGLQSMIPLMTSDDDYHSADNILLSVDITGDLPKLRAFQLTNEIWNSGPGAVQGSGNIMVKYFEDELVGNNNDLQVFAADTGSIMKKEGSNLGVLADHSCSSGNNDACDALLTDSIKDIDTIGENPPYSLKIFQDQLETISPVHENKGWYAPQGEIIAGYEPDHYVYGSKAPESREGPKFFICRSDYVRGAVMVSGEDGDYTPQVVDVSDSSSTSPELYKCEGTEWKQVNECNDGLDNDGDGGIDVNNPDGQSDTDCGSTADTEAPSTCNPRVGRLASDYEDPDNGVKYSEGTKVAFHDSSDTKFSDSTSTCGYNNFDPHVDYTGEPPELFTCNELLTGAQDYSSTDLEDDGNAVDQGGADYFCDSLTNYHSNSEMKAVEYFVPKSKIPTGVNKYATTTGFKNNFYQSLHDAETKNAGSDPVHDKSTWDNIGLIDLSDGYNTGEYIDSWTIGNAGAENANKIQSASSVSGETVNESSVFNGGFAGSCDNNLQWQYRSREKQWVCSGEPSFTQELFMPDIHSQGSKATVGFHIMPNFFRQSSKYQGINTFYFGLDDSPKYSTGHYVSEVEGMCWAGQQSRYSSYSSIPNDEKVAIEVSGVPSGTGIQNPIPVFGEINIPSGRSSFSCRWSLVDDSISSNVFKGAGLPVRVGKKKDMQNFVNERSFSSTSIDLSEEYRSGMGSSRFRSVSQEWESEHGLSISRGDSKSMLETWN
jgi:hypothetical protein